MLISAASRAAQMSMSGCLVRRGSSGSALGLDVFDPPAGFFRVELRDERIEALLPDATGLPPRAREHECENREHDEHPHREPPEPHAKGRGGWRRFGFRFGCFGEVGHAAPLLTRPFRVDVGAAA